jgi:hypothetical protein
MNFAGVVAVETVEQLGEGALGAVLAINEGSDDR